MVIYSGIVKVSSFIVNLICSVICPVVGSIGYMIKIGGDCECSSPYPSEHGRRHKKVKNSGSNSNHNDVKRIKLLLDITVGKNGSQVLDIQASTSGGGDGGYKDKEEQQCQKSPGLILWFLNIPSSVMLWFVHKIKKWADTLDALSNPPCEESNRIKKSPKRRITRANYRKIIPFFPFNLLGFSNYSAFQMPIITRSCSSSITGGVAEDSNNLNVSSISANGRARCKRRRSSTTEDSSSTLSDDDISYLELSEKTNNTRSALPPSSSGGHDEVDSDETADTVTKRKVSSSSSGDNNLRQNYHSVKDIGRKIIVALNTSTSEDNGASENVTDLDSSRDGVVGEEHQVRFSCIEELNEAVNESYNSKDDPDYVPPEHVTSSSDSSFATGKGCSDEEMFLRENGYGNGNGSVTNEKDDDKEVQEEEKSTPVEKPEDGKSEPEITPKPNGGTPTTVASPVTTSSPAVVTTAASAPNSTNKKKNKKQNKKQNGNNSNNYRNSPVPPTNLEPFSTVEDDYKTPEEGEHEGQHRF